MFTPFVIEGLIFIAHIETKKPIGDLPRRFLLHMVRIAQTQVPAHGTIGELWEPEQPA
jgi:hypothetical protein